MSPTAPPMPWALSITDSVTPSCRQAECGGRGACFRVAAALPPGPKTSQDSSLGSSRAAEGHRGPHGFGGSGDAPVDGCTMPAVPPMPSTRCGRRGRTPPMGIRHRSSSWTCSRVELAETLLSYGSAHGPDISPLVAGTRGGVQAVLQTAAVSRL